MSEQQRAMQNAASIATRDPRLSAQVDAILAARHSDPFALLGPHAIDSNWTVRFFLPWASNACISLTPPVVEGGTLSAAKVIEAARFVRTIDVGKPVGATIEDAVRAAEVLDAMARSAENGVWEVVAR